MKTYRTWLTAILSAMLLAACTDAVDPAQDDSGPASTSPSPRTLEVCEDGCPFSQLAPALAEARDGDTVTIGAGVYRGGVVVQASVQIVGAGTEETIIRGGGPVITIGEYEADAQPTVTIEGVTITGGLTRTSPVSFESTGKDGVMALGGGVEIPQSVGRSLGATVTITNSAITRNRVAPSTTTPTGPECPHGACPFSLAAGGGIDNWGTLTLQHTSVSDNVVGAVPGLRSLASDAQGAGIMSWLGELTIVGSTIHHNVARATAPNGRYAEGGGIMLPESGDLTLRDSWVTNNRAQLDAALPASVDMMAQPGGIFVSDAATSVTITETSIQRNVASMTNTVGDATAFAGGINVWGVDFEMTGSIVSNNHVRAVTLGNSRGNASGDGGGAELVGTIVHSRISGNTVTARSRAGDAIAAIGGLLQDDGSLVHTSVSGNELHAFSPNGSVSVFGAGITVGQEPLTVRGAFVDENRATGIGVDGYVRGGGIFDGPTLWDIPGAHLILISTNVRNNVVGGSAGLVTQGGGIFIEGHRLTTEGRGFIRGNVPDQVFRRS